MKYDEISNRIRKYRVAQGLSQERMLEELRDRGTPMGRNTLSGLENGKEEAFRSASLVQLAEICEILGCSIGHLLGEYECRDYRAQVVQEETGLREGAIGSLRVLKEENNTTAFADLVSLALESENIAYSLSLLGDFVSRERRGDLSTFVDSGPVVFGGSFSALSDDLSEALISTHFLSEARSIAERYDFAILPADRIEFSEEADAVNRIKAEGHEEATVELARNYRRASWNDPNKQNPFLSGDDDYRFGDLALQIKEMLKTNESS